MHNLQVTNHEMVIMHEMCEYKRLSVLYLTVRMCVCVRMFSACGLIL